MVDAITQIAGDRTLTLTLHRPTRDDNPFILDARTLEAGDQLIAAYLERVVPLLEASAPPVTARLRAQAEATPCLANTGDSNVDDLICRKQRLDQERAQQPVAMWNEAARLETAVYLGWLGAWMGTAVADEALVAASPAKALQLVWATATSYLTSYATLQPPPPLSPSLLAVGTRLLDGAALGGVPLTLSAVTAFDAHVAAAEVAIPRPTCADPGVLGITVSSLPESVSGRLFRVRSIRRTATNGQAALASTCIDDRELSVTPAQATSSIDAATTAEPAVGRWNGVYTGSFSGTSSGNVQFQVTSGQIDVTVPEGASGVVSAAGRIVYGIADTCTFGGRFTLVSGQARAAGGWTCNDGEKGRWNAAR